MDACVGGRGGDGWLSVHVCVCGCGGKFNAWVWYALPCGLSITEMCVDGGVFKFLNTVWVNGKMSASTPITDQLKVS